MTAVRARRLSQTEGSDRIPSPLPAHLSIGGDDSSASTPSGIRAGTPVKRVIHDVSTGYVSEPFAGKDAQMEKVMDALDQQGFIPGDLIENETKWFYNNLGIDDYFFEYESVENITRLILSVYAAKVAAYSRNDRKLVIRLDHEEQDHAVYIDTSVPGESNLAGPQFESRIDKKYLDLSSPSRAYRVETFRSSGSFAQTEQIRCYFVYKCDFINPTPKDNETDLSVISDKNFFQRASINTKATYQSIMNAAVDRTGPVIEVFQVEGTREHRLIVAYQQQSAAGFFSAISDLYHYYGLTSARKYVEQFSNGYTIASIYLRPVAKHEEKFPPIESSVYQVLKEASLLFCIPRSLFQSHFASRKLSLQEAIYAHCVTIFVSHFLNRLGSEYASLQSILDSNNPSHQAVLSRLKRRLRQETFTKDYILELMDSQLDVLRSLYLSFADKHYINTYTERQAFLPTLSYQRLKSNRVLPDNELEELIKLSAQNDHQALVMNAVMTFNKHLLKTNFYTPTKVALSFRFDPKFLPETEYPINLYGMFLVVGQEFRGFHLRFRDIARGGIRIVKSRSPEVYASNARTMFDENYNLASTQQRKNKDIPEGGAKGVILLDYAYQDREAVAFQKYIDAIIDLLLKGDSPGIKDPIVDFYGKEEILFMGPDENTAPLVDWATLHARERGAAWWKSFFTGKKPILGGIPHDTYGMTSRSVREYVLGIYRKLHINEAQVTKMQTGGPDGDLGSNEILLSNEKYTTIIDGSGVLSDPDGLDRPEVERLAKERVMISHYDIKKLGPRGFRVLVDDKNVQLPSGEIVPNGVTFRNEYHLVGDAQLFVPCGGRPEAIDLRNVERLIKDGKSRIPWIVEGANLFITQEAKIRLEQAGCILFKDASANKGGVTSSSLEVLASLAFSDDEFFEHMCMSKDGQLPEFYKKYVKDVERIIQQNARLEFEALWAESVKTGSPKSVLSDILSRSINKLAAELQESTLWIDTEFRNGVLKHALPPTLLAQIGLDKILERVPESYLRAIFGSYLAARFIYAKGPTADQFAFFEYMVETRQKILGSANYDIIQKD